MNQREAKKHATEHLAEAAREIAGLYRFPDGGKLELVGPADRQRLARAYGELADELTRRYDPAARVPQPEPVDPNQISMFEEAV